MKKSQLNRISKSKLQYMLDNNIAIPADSFQVAKKLAKKKRGARSKKVWHNDVQHGSLTQLNVFKMHELMQLAGEISDLDAEVDFPLNAEGGAQIGLHRIDIIFFNIRKKHYQFYNVKGDYPGSIDALSIWKKKHTERQYPTWHGFPVRYDFYIAEKDGSRVFRKESELIEHLTS